MAEIVRSDPLRNFKFQVEINYVTKSFLNEATRSPLARLGFMSVSGLSMQTEMIPYREGGMNTVSRKMPGQSDFPQVSFQRGLFQGKGELFDWFKDIFYIDNVNGRGPNADFRCDITIRVMQHPIVRVAGVGNTLVEGGGGSADTSTTFRNRAKQLFVLKNAWPTSLAFSDLDAGGNGIIMEQMTVAHEGLIPIYASSSTDLSSVATGKGYA